MSDCVFCGIVAGGIPATVVHRDELAVAFHDISPSTPVHVLVVPVRHIGGIAEVVEGDAPVVGHLLAVAASVARGLGLEDNGYRVVVNQGRDGGQSEGHLHLHVLGGRKMRWPPG